MTEPVDYTQRFEGVDVSYVQRSGIDFQALRKADFRFSIAKTTEGNGGIDPYFKPLTDAARAAGLYVGSYHFARPDASDQDAIRELESYFANSRGLGTHPGELPPMLDFESYGKLAASTSFEWCELWIYLAYRYWQRWPIVYTGSWFWEAMGAKATSAEWLRNCPLMIAEYPIDYRKDPARARTYVPKLGAKPRVPKPWQKASFWQWAGTGGPRPDGCKVDIDRDFFFGTEADLQKLAGH